MPKPVYVYNTFIAAPAERVWEALTTAEFTRRYFYATDVASDWQPGSPVIYTGPDGTKVVEGEVLESDPPRKLVITWRPLYSPEFADEPPSRVTFDIQALEGASGLRVTHDHFEEGSLVYEEIRQGWSAILCGLKTVLETGESLPRSVYEARAPEAVSE